MSKRPYGDLLASSEAEIESSDRRESNISTTEPSKHSRSKSKKTYECTYPGCGKNYSRAEHLHRHQLNHNPKEIYKCNHPGCERSFVRQDLCIRHQERHLTQGKHASRLNREDSMNHESRRESRSIPASPPGTSGRDSASGNSSDSPHRNNATDTVNGLGIARPQSFVMPSSGRLAGFDPHIPENDFNPLGSPGPGSITWSVPINGHSSSSRRHKSIAVEEPKSMHSHTNVGQMTFPDLTQDTTANNPVPNYSLPTFGERSISESPASIRDEFASWLFDDFASVQPSFFPLAGQGNIGLTVMPDAFGAQVYPNYFADPALNNVFPDILQKQFSTPANEASPGLGHDTYISIPKRQRLLDLMEYNFSESDNEAVRDLKREIMQVNRDMEGHVLSMTSMQLYISSYWHHFHAQMPILHQPTFQADDTHDYLLLAMMAIGASFLNKAHGNEATQRASRLANFIAWHLRWQVFMSSDFQPPAKLWVFQTLILLEVYEKANATRALHERAHIHYPTTITLMRRGTALIDDPSRDPSRSQKSSTTAQEWWNRWITAEATRRAAFAAFYLDALHATMFNHAAMMVVHEVQLPLPCDDALWSATSAGEVGRVEASLHANGIKPTTFLDGLKKTLTGRKVRTNNFGRLILMAGLMSVSWHMHQRDLQVSSLGVPHTMGAPGRWRDSLTKSFDFWKKDFDENAAHMRRAALPWQKGDLTSDEDALSKTAFLLHHFSHMAMQVDLMDAQIFAGSHKLLGRIVTTHDQSRVREKMAEWVKSPGSRVAVYHSIQVLRNLLLPGINNAANIYNARDDHIYQRSWILYHSALIVWCYGYATEGPLRPFPTHLSSPASPTTPRNSLSGALGIMPSQQQQLQQQSQQVQTTIPAQSITTSPPLNFLADHQKQLCKDANSFLTTVGAVSSPQELETVKSGRNNVAGILLLTELSFRDSKWELLREAGGKLLRALALLKGGE